MYANAQARHSLKTGVGWYRYRCISLGIISWGSNLKRYPLSRTLLHPPGGCNHSANEGDLTRLFVY